MSDHAEVLVFNTPEPQRVGADLLARLVAEQIVMAEVTDCILGKGGHAPGPEVAKATAESEQVLSLRVNGQEIEHSASGELYFSPEGGDPWVTCPRCRRKLEQEHLFEHLNERQLAQKRHTEESPWGAAPTRPDLQLKCPGCQGEWQLREWTAHECAFGTIACFFWNWPLRESFIDQVLLWTGAPLVRVRNMI